MAEQVLENDEAMSEEYQNNSFIGQLYCDPCHDDGNQVTAFGFCVDCNDYLCAECYQAHKRTRQVKHHVLRDADNLPVRKPRGDKGQEICSDHPAEPIKWYCNSHDQVICDVCKHIDHRQCIELSTLSDISQNILSSDKLKQVEGKLRTKQVDFQENKTRIDKNHNAVEGYYEELIKSVTMHISKIRDKDRTMMAGLQLTCDAVTTSITSQLDKLKTLKQDEDKERMFVLMKKVESQLPILDRRLESLKRDNKIQRYTYVPGTSTGSTQSVIVGKIVKAPIKVGEIEVKTSSDTSDCWITGMDSLSDNKLVLADRYNGKIKLVDMKTMSVISELKLDACLWDLTKLGDQKIAISTLESKKILIVSVVSDTLTVQKTIDKNEYSQCQGIVYSNGSLIVSHYRPNKIEILDLNGSVKQNIDNKDKDGNVRFENVFYITQSPDTLTLYLSDYSHNKIVGMTLDGKIISSFVHEHLTTPRGITIGRDGRLFVCSQGDEKIFELCSDLSKGEVLFGEKDGISNPYSIMYNDEEDMLYVGGDNCNTIQVFLV